MNPTPVSATNRGLKLLAIAFLAAGLGLLGWVGYTLFQGKAPAGAALEPSDLLGGAFTAENHLGEPVSEQTFRGKYMLMYFGFTFCPDVCPGELQIIGAAMDMLGEDSERITPVFVSIDPERDRPEVLADYVPHFHDRMIGLTGTPEQIAGLARAWKVYYSRVEDENMPGGYVMDHSSIIYLMDPDGRFLKHFPHGTPPEDIAAGIRAIL